MRRSATDADSSSRGSRGGSRLPSAPAAQRHTPPASASATTFRSAKNSGFSPESSLYARNEALSSLKMLFAGMLVVSLLLTIGAWYAWYRTHLYQLLTLGCFSPLAVLSAAISYVGIDRSQKELGDRAALLSRVKGMVGEDIAQFGLYACMCAFAGLLLLGSGCLLYQDQLGMVLKAEAADAEVWAQRHPSATPESIHSQFSLYLLSIGSLCLLYCLLGLVAFAKQVTLSVDNESQHVLVQVLSFIQLSLGVLLLFTVGFMHKAKSEVGLEGVTDSSLTLLGAAGVCAIVTAVLCFRAANKEIVLDIAVYILFSLATVAFTGYLVVSYIYSERVSASDLNDSCLDSMALINEDYLQMLGCARKYVEEGHSVDQLQCMKSQVRSVWEREGVACLNAECCGYFLSATQSILTYAVITLLGCGVVELLSVIASGFLIAKIVSKGTSIFHEADGRVFFLMLLVGVVGGGLISATTVFTPYAKQMTNSPSVVLMAGHVDDSLLGAELCLSAPQIHLPAWLANCTNCAGASFHTEIQVENGHIRLSAPANVSVLQSQRDLLTFDSESVSQVSSEVRQTLFCPDCPDISGSISLSITRSVRENRLLRGLQPRNTTETILQYQGSVSLESGVMDLFTGVVTASGQPLSGVDVSVRQKSCHSLTFQTNSTGKYSFSLPTNVDFSPVPVSIAFSKSGYQSVTYTQHTGGLPLFFHTKTRDISMVSTSALPASLRLTVLSALRNREIRNATLELRTGLNNFTGEFEYQLQTNGSSAVSIPSLPAGVYSIAASSPGFSQTQREFFLESGSNRSETVLLSPSDLSDGQVRVVLMWTGDTVDLDLKSRFDVSGNRSCEVGFSSRLCAGVRLAAESNSGPGGEAITMEEVGPFLYLFTVEVAGKPMEFSGNVQPEIAIYTSAQSFPVFRQAFPQSSGGRFWSAFCLNGLEGVATLFPLNFVTDFPVNSNVCQQIYSNPDANSAVPASRLERKQTEIALPKAFTHWRGSN